MTTHTATGVTPLPPHSRWSGRVRAAVLALAALSLLAVALLGLRRYIDNYETYRGFPPPSTPTGVAGAETTGTVTTERFFSPALGHDASYTLYRPPGYAAAVRAGRRYPVLYLLHAPPGSANGYLTIGAVAVRMDELIAAHQIRPFMLVIPDGHTSVDGDDTEWADAGAGRYMSFVLDTVRNVDARWAALPDRGDRAIAGLSEGGYGATNVALRNLGLFGTFESWSGYFTQTPTYAYSGANAAQLRAASPRDYVGELAPALRRLPTYAFLYRGTNDRITSAADTYGFAARFRAAGGHVTVAQYPGSHNWWLWRTHIPQQLRFASAHFAPAAGRATAPHTALTKGAAR
jgi:enterochelin esterase-like enzyme